MEKKSQQSSSSTTNDKNLMFVVLRDQNSNELRIAPQNEVTSTKTPSKLAVGDLVSYGPRGKRVRGVILVIGNI